MPVIASSYSPPFYIPNRHLQTIIPAIFYPVRKQTYHCERINTKDNDFVDIDWIRKGNKRLAIISHGLEGSSDAPYMHRMAEALSADAWDVLCWNFRGCSSVPNSKPQFYHSGFTSDLDDVVHHAVNINAYDEIMLIGFSIGGNITLKYLGEQSGNILPAVKKAVVFSVPCDLESGAVELRRCIMYVYMRRFLVSFKQKFMEKNKLFPGSFDMSNYDKIKNFFQFDSIYTAPMFGFKDVHDYYSKASSKPYLAGIKIPTLIVNAANDPFLGKECFPFEEALNLENVFLEVPKQGGHVGFPISAQGYWPAKERCNSGSEIIDYLHPFFHQYLNNL